MSLWDIVEIPRDTVSPNHIEVSRQTHRNFSVGSDLSKKLVQIVTLHRVLGRPCQSSPIDGTKIDLIRYHIISEYTIVTGPCWIRPVHPLSTITLVTHPLGENHELAIGPNYYLAIT